MADPTGRLAMPSPNLRIATYNVNGIRPRLGALLEWLAREKPDVVCLQELKAADEAFPASDIHDAGYGALWLGQKSWNGVAILARGTQPVERRRGLPGDEADLQSRYLEADIHGLVVACLYLPNGNPWPGPKFDYKLEWFERLIEHARTLRASRAPTILAGDYNVVPTDADIYDPRNWRKDALLQPESRAAYQRLLAQGWTDALRARHPDERIYTFWDYFRQHRERNAGLRIDHLLLSDELAPRLVDAGVDGWVRDRPSPSDHAPTWVAISTDAGGSATVQRPATARKTPKSVATVDAPIVKPRVAKKTPVTKRAAKSAAHAAKTPAAAAKRPAHKVARKTSPPKK
ncbi:MAG: Exodeoxyribonuclease III [uncultured Lysobacter sp.]|uniref:Exodeoxyribonuclease III n=1 Tax=uncultured Lysobacter sp. TaxID=271060 RepID=A0A6J4M4Q1_9GAMM|nr:MAG: Exodeoxyribonuclease III [uncultured Lysobacter sp.]